MSECLNTYAHWTCSIIYVSYMYHAITKNTNCEGHSVDTYTSYKHKLGRQ